MESVKAVSNQMVPPCVDLRGETDNQATHLSAIVQAWRFSLFGHIARMPDETDAKKILTASPPPREVEETTRMPSYYMDVGYPAEPEIQ